MLYLEHDFYRNFSGGVNSGDNELVTDIIVNEISELIVYKTPELIDLLNTVGIRTKEKASDEKLVDAIINNLSKNVKLSKGLAYLIATNNDSKGVVKVVKGKDGQERRIRKNTKQVKISDIDMIASGIVGLGDSFIYKPQLKKEFKIKLMNTIKTKSKAVGDRTRKHDSNKNGKYWLLAFLVVGASVGLYFIIKHRKKVAAEGIDTTPVETKVEPQVVETPPPTPEPIATPPVEAAPVAQPTVPVEPVAVV